MGEPSSAMGQQNDPVPPQPQAPLPDASGSNLLRAAGLIAIVTVLSKILGFFRDWQIMHVYGATLTTDAYFAAFQLPSFAIVLLGGLGGPFNTAAVAVFSRLHRPGEPPSDKAKLLGRVFITMTGVAFLFLSGLAYIYARPIMGVILGGGSDLLINTAAEQLRTMSPIIFIGAIAGIFYGIANVHNRFFWPSFSPSMISIVMIVLLFINPHDATGKILALATLAGCIGQIVVQLPDFFAEKYSLMPSFRWRDPEISPEMHRIGEILFPAVIGTTIGQLTAYVDMFFTSFLPSGGWTSVVLGNRLIQLPIGVLQTALLVPIFPMFTRYVMGEQWDDLRRYFRAGVVSLWFISMPLLVLMMMYTEPIIRLVFQHGKFDAAATSMVTLVLVYQAFSMLPYYARDSITRVFYAFHDSRTPLLVGLAAITLKAFLDWLFVGPMHLGVGGIALATTIITFFNMTLLGLLIRKHIDYMGFKEMVMPFAKLLAAGCVMFGIMKIVGEAIAIIPLPVRPGIAEWIHIMFCSCVGMFIYGVTAYAFKVPEVKYLTNRVMGKLAEKLRLGGS